MSYTGSSLLIQTGLLPFKYWHASWRVSMMQISLYAYWAFQWDIQRPCQLSSKLHTKFSSHAGSRHEVCRGANLVWWFQLQDQLQLWRHHWLHQESLAGQATWKGESEETAGYYRWRTMTIAAVLISNKYNKFLQLCHVCYYHIIHVLFNKTDSKIPKAWVQ